MEKELALHLCYSGASHWFFCPPSTSILMEKADAIALSLTDMVFEYRNKAYGAYQLRQSYDHYLRRDTLAGCTGFLVQREWKNPSDGKSQTLRLTALNRQKTHRLCFLKTLAAPGFWRKKKKKKSSSKSSKCHNLKAVWPLWANICQNTCGIRRQPATGELPGWSMYNSWWTAEAKSAT